MSENPNSEELPNTVFEDAEDFLEFCYEKIEDAVYFWTLWAKTFMPEVEEKVVRALILEFAGTLHEELHSRMHIATIKLGDDTEMLGLIRRSASTNRSCDTQSPE